MENNTISYNNNNKTTECRLQKLHNPKIYSKQM